MGWEEENLYEKNRKKPNEKQLLNFRQLIVI